MNEPVDAKGETATVRRPWGAYTVLEEGPGYKIKRITVGSKQALSLQFHHHRAEHWVVVSGTALVRVGDEESRISSGGYRHIPQRAVHRLSNERREALVLIEIQCGDYLGEDDIVRLADVYGRA